MEKEAKIFVAGHKGLVGSAIVRGLEIAGYTNIIVRSHEELDLTNQIDVFNFFSKNEPEYVFLCAAKVGGIHANATYPADFIYSNIQIQTNIINAAHTFKVRKLLFLGSSCIYPKYAPQPMKEEYLLSGSLEPTNAAYAIAKIAGIIMCQSYNKQYLNGCKYISVMPTNLYGECFSEDTDVMTPQGIINIKNLKIGDKIYTLNPQTDEIELSPIIRTHKVKTDEFLLMHNKGVDFKLTKNHDLWYQTALKKNKIKKKASEFISKIGGYGQITLLHHKCKEVDNNIYDIISLKDCIDDYHVIDPINQRVRDHKHSHSKSFPYLYKMEDFIKFIGWYISEGSTSITQQSLGGVQSTSKLDVCQIRISQSKVVNKKNCDDIEKTLKNMGLPVQRDKSDKGAYYFTSRLFLNYIRKNIGIGSKNVKIPQFIFNEDFPTKYRRLLFEILMRGDGNKNLRRYNTASFDLMSQLSHLCFLLGIKISSINYDSGCYRLGIRIKRKNCTIKFKNIKIIKENSYSYCVTAEKNHIIYAGRGGKFNWVGQCDNYHSMDSHVLPALIRRFHEAKMRGDDKVTIWGSGLATREFLYSDDLADACLFLMNNYDSSDIINIGYGEEISIRDLANLIKDVVGFKGILEFDRSKPDGTPRKLVDSSKLSGLGWRPKISLETGLKITYENYQSLIEQKTCRL